MSSPEDAGGARFEGAAPGGRRRWSVRRAGRTAGVLVACSLTLAACGSHAESVSLQVRSWAGAAQLGQSLRLLATDVDEVSRGIKARKLVATHTACDGMATDAANAEGVLPSPDQTLTDELNRAYLGLVRAAQDCSDAGHFGGGAFDRYRSEARRAVASLHAAEARLALLEAPRRRGAGAG